MTNTIPKYEIRSPHMKITPTVQSKSLLFTPKMSQDETLTIDWSTAQANACWNIIR